MRLHTILAAMVAALGLAGCASSPPVSYISPGSAGQYSSVATPGVSPQEDPPKLASLEPFRAFGLGQGHGYARTYRNRSIPELVGLLRSPAEFSRQMRVSCSIWVRQVAEAHPGTPWESCEGAAAALERGGYASVACTDQMLAQNWLAVTDAEGHAFGVWHRRCLPGEQLLVQGDQLLASLLCINPGVPAGAPPAPPPMMPVATGGCPAVDILKINIWGHEALALPGVERTDANEQLANRFDVYNRIAHVSYDNGAQFRQAYAAGQIGRSRQPHMMQLSFIMTSQAHGGAPDILREQIVGVVPVTGLYEWRIPAAVRRVWDAERVVPVNSDVSSPPASGQTGYHELRFFNHLPENPTEGEWARNPVPDCVMNEHFIE